MQCYFVLAMKSGSVCQDCTQRTPRNSVVSVQNYLNKVNMNYSLCVFDAFVTDIPVGEAQTLCGVRKYLPHTKDLPGQVTSLSHFAAELWKKRDYHTIQNFPEKGAMKHLLYLFLCLWKSCENAQLLDWAAVFFAYHIDSSWDKRVCSWFDDVCMSELSS